MSKAPLLSRIDPRYASNVAGPLPEEIERLVKRWPYLRMALGFVGVSAVADVLGGEEVLERLRVLGWLGFAPDNTVYLTAMAHAALSPKSGKKGRRR